ncbi:MAG: tetratricopeptide repeat protein [Pseudomonadota bacterium]
MRLLLLLISLFITTITAQAQKARDWITLGDERAEQNDWMAALSCYTNAFELDSAEFDYALKYAEALRMTRDYAKAEYYYDKLYSKDRGKVYKQGQFWLAMMQKHNGNYTQALRNFKKYSKKVKRESEGYEYRKCIQEIEACTWAINARRDDSEVQIEKIDDPISTPASDLGAWLLPDSTFLFASARKKGNEIPIHLWYADFDSTYSNPEQVEGGKLTQQANMCFAAIEVSPK